MYFGHLTGLGVFWSLQRFQGYFGHFRYFPGVFGRFRGLGLFWSIYRFWDIFGNFRGSGLFLVILKVLGVFGHFKGLGLFWSFFRFRVYFSHHIGFRGIFVIL